MLVFEAESCLFINFLSSIFIWGCVPVCLELRCDAMFIFFLSFKSILVAGGLGPLGGPQSYYRGPPDLCVIEENLFLVFILTS